jgi:hypothetical protein
MCTILTDEISDGDALLDEANWLLVLGSHLCNGERVEAARRAFGPEAQLEDNGYTAVCWCGLEVDVSKEREGAYVLD